MTEGIIYMARITSEDQENESWKGLMKFLMREGHWSPFDMLNVNIEVVTERDVSRQILRHPFFVQEWSQRYGDASEMISARMRETRLQDTTNRQNSFKCDDPVLDDWWQSQQAVLVEQTTDLYKQAIGKGIAKEVARAILPEGLTETKLYLNGTVRQWLFYLKARRHESTQKEHRVLAFQIRSILKSLMPELMAAFEELYMQD